MSKKFEVDPRILANTQKILQYLTRIAEDQQKLKQAMKLTMNEQQKFQNDVYQSFRILDGDLRKACDNIEGLHEVTDNINSRVKSIHRHVKGVHGSQEMTDCDSVKVSNNPSSGAGHLQNHMSSSSRFPKTTGEKSTKKRLLPIDKYIPNSNDDDTESDPNNMGATGGDPKRPLRGPINRPNNQSRLSPARRPVQMQSPNIQVPENHSKVSPVPIRNQPPRDTHRPNPREPGPNSQPGVFDVSEIKRYPPDRQPLVSANPSEADIYRQLASVDISRPSVAAIANACCRGDVQASPTVGLHTVLVLDTSASMAGHPLNTMKTFVNGMLDRIDESAGNYGLEEHIAMVTCGANVDIEQPFTNDFMAFRNKLDTLLAGGRTPLLTALAMALFYLEINGETVEMFNYQIPPRVVVVSDFQITQDDTFEGNDVDSSEVRIKSQRQIFKMAQLFHNFGYPVFWVPLGDCNQSVCGGACTQSKGLIIQVNKPEVAGNFYRYQTIIACVLKDYDAAKDEGRDDNTRDLIAKFLPQLGLEQTDIDHIEDLMSSTLEMSDDDLDEIDIENDVENGVDGTDVGQPRTSPSHGQPRIETPVSGNEGPPAPHMGHRPSPGPPAVRTPPTRNPIAMPAIPTQTARTPTPQTTQRQTTNPVDPPGAESSAPFLPEWTLTPNLEEVGFEERADLPLIGTRVVRSKDWKWDNQDGNGPGTVVGHHDKGLVFIVWDNTNTIGIFRHRHDGDKFDVEVLNEPRSVTEGTIEIGCWVTRGPDWNKGDEDGGNGTVGVVIRKLPDRLVQVRWPSRVIETYSFGANNKWELKVTMTKALNEFQSAPRETEASPEAGAPPEAAADMTLEERPTVPGEEDTLPAWYWQDRAKQWRVFSQDAIDKIESTYEKKPDGAVMVHRKNQSVKIFLDQLQCEMNEKRMPIRRDTISEAEMKNVQFMEEMLPD